MRTPPLKLSEQPPAEIGSVYGRLTVVAEELRPPHSKNRRKVWRCVCTCGNRRLVLDQSLRLGATRSCGCLASEVASALHSKHGETVGGQSPTYRSWRDMKSRCNNPNTRCFKNYGGRGISYDSRWESFHNFLEDMGECPTGLTLDRKDPNKGYSKDNCHWADWYEQAANKRSCATRNIEYMGENLSPREWSEKLGISVNTIYGRRRRGLSPSAIFARKETNEQ